MILVDSSVWTDFFNGQDTPQTDRLNDLLGNEPLGIGDLILAEVLQGFRSDAEFRTARDLLTSLSLFQMLGIDNAIRSAEYYRLLRQRGITIRKTADVIIATFCIIEGHALLFSDRDFVPFVKQLHLREVATGS